ncbi:MAG TPA: hypothetical protein VN688_10860, partial [Gemmataceae bacterium]|nr:hypothetical protein [Gemmataceae bacterium]
DSNKSPPIQAVKKSTPPPPTKSDPPLTKIPTRKENPEVIKNKESGIIHGVIRWEGTEPSPPTPRLRIDSTTHGISQTAVWLVSGKRTIPASTEPISLVVEQGEYRPHVVLAQRGNSVELGTIDERADFQASGAATFSETLKRGNKRRFPLSSPGLIEVRSQLQPKRTPAYIWVLDGSPGAISGTEGRFRLPPVPPGDYELVGMRTGTPGNPCRRAACRC